MHQVVIYYDFTLNGYQETIFTSFFLLKMAYRKFMGWGTLVETMLFRVLNLTKGQGKWVGLMFIKFINLKFMYIYKINNT
jgi:hypothetical protein